MPLGYAVMEADRRRRDGDDRGQVEHEFQRRRRTMGFILVSSGQLQERHRLFPAFIERSSRHAGTGHDEGLDQIGGASVAEGGIGASLPAHCLFSFSVYADNACPSGVRCLPPRDAAREDRCVHSGRGRRGSPGAHSSASRSQPPKSAAARYVLSRNARSVASGSLERRTASYGSRNSPRLLS